MSSEIGFICASRRRISDSHGLTEEPEEAHARGHEHCVRSLTTEARKVASETEVAAVRSKHSPQRIRLRVKTVSIAKSPRQPVDVALKFVIHSSTRRNPKTPGLARSMRGANEKTNCNRFDGLSLCIPDGTHRAGSK